MKRIIMTLAMIFVATLLAAAPANAATMLDSAPLSCTYDSPGIPKISGWVRVWTIDGDPDRYNVVMHLDGDPYNRTWDWRLWHNGDLSATSQEGGIKSPESNSYTASRTILDFAGQDKLRWNVQNLQNTAICNAWVYAP